MRPPGDPSGRGGDSSRASEFGAYMANKVAKLGVQFDTYAARAVESVEASDAAGALFAGVVIHVNGLTMPSAAVRREGGEGRDR